MTALLEIYLTQTYRVIGKIINELNIVLLRGPCSPSALLDLSLVGPGAGPDLASN